MWKKEVKSHKIQLISARGKVQHNIFHNFTRNAKRPEIQSQWIIDKDTNTGWVPRFLLFFGKCSLRVDVLVAKGRLMVPPHLHLHIFIPGQGMSQFKRSMHFKWIKSLLSSLSLPYPPKQRQIVAGSFLFSWGTILSGMGREEGSAYTHQMLS